MIPCTFSDILIDIFSLIFLPFVRAPHFPISPSDHLHILQFPFTFFTLSFVLTSFLFPKGPPFSISMIRLLVPYNFPLYCSPTTLSWQMSHFAFLVSVVTTGCVFTSDDLELGTSNMKEHMLVFMGLSYLTPYFNLPVKFMIPSIFTAEYYTVAYI